MLIYGSSDEFEKKVKDYRKLGDKFDSFRKNKI